MDAVEVLPFLDANMEEVEFSAEALLLQPDGSLAGMLTSNWSIPEGGSFVVRAQGCMWSTSWGKSSDFRSPFLLDFWPDYCGT